MKITALTAGFALCLAPPGWAADPSRSGTAQTLVQALELDVRVADTTNQGVRRQLAKGSIPARRAACIARFTPREFTADIVALVDRKFTEEEMKEVIDFYRTPLGRKLLLGLRYLQQKGDPEADSARIPEPRFTKAELDAEAAFAETSAGKKAFEDNFFLTSPEFQALIRDKALAARDRCKATGQ